VRVEGGLEFLVRELKDPVLRVSNNGKGVPVTGSSAGHLAVPRHFHTKAFVCVFD
jgi:hypothetical protein